MQKSDIIYKSKNEISYNHLYTEKSDVPHPFYHAESHSKIEISLILSGKTDYFINGSRYHMGTGDLLVINAGEFHTSQVDHNEDYEHLNLHFSPNYIPKLKDIDASAPFTNAKLYQHVLPRNIVEKSKIPSLFRKIDKLSKNQNPYKELEIISVIQAIIAELNVVTAYLLVEEYNFLTAPKITNQLFQDAIQYVNENVAQNVNVATVADALGVSESYLHRLFKKIMGISVHSYIMHQKMQYALSLLRQGHSAQNVSEMLGYDYYMTFYTQFTKVFGKPPTQFK